MGKQIGFVVDIAPIFVSLIKVGFNHFIISKRIRGNKPIELINRVFESFLLSINCFIAIAVLRVYAVFIS